MDTPQIDLSGLRDIHLPIKPDFWPLAWGWWALLGGIILAIIAIIVFLRFWRNLPEVYALRKLNKITADKKDDLEYLKAVSTLLKRVAIAVYGRTQIALLSDQTWQDFLLQAAPETLTEKQAHQLAFAIYEPKQKTPLKRPVFAQNAAEWIKKVFKNKKSS